MQKHLQMNALPPRISNKINTNGPIPDHAPHLGPCWLWMGAITKGYGKVAFRGQMTTAHRAVFITLMGELETSQHLDHLCRNKPCCNPAHLEPVTPKVNVARALALKTHCQRGHARIPANTGKHGGCRICNNLRQNAKYATDPNWREHRKRVERERHQRTKNTLS